MRPMVVAIAAGNTGASAPLPLDHYQSPFHVGFGLVISGTATVSVQHSFDEIAVTTPASATWFNHPSVSGVTASIDGNYAFPVRAIRINLSSGTGSATLTAIQAGGRA